MSFKQFILLSLSLTLAGAAAPRAQAQYAGLGQARQMIIEAQQKAEAEKAKQEKEAADGATSPTAATAAPVSDTAGPPTDEVKKEVEKKVTPESDKKAEAEKKPETDKKTEDEKKAEAAKKSELDKKAEDEKKAEAEKKAEEEKKAAARQPEGKLSYDPLKDAMFAINVGKYNDSINLLNQVLTRDTNNAQARYLLAFTYVMQRKYTEAAEQYRRVLKLAPNSPIGKLAADGLSKIAK